MLFWMIIAASLLTPAVTYGSEIVPPRERDRALLAMEHVEDRSEELANDLVDLADVLKKRDFDKAPGWLAAGFTGEPLFAGTPAATHPRPSLTREVYEPAHDRTVGAAAWLAPLFDRLRTWRRVEDTRFKVKASRFEDAAARAGEATLFTRYEGTDAAGRPIAITLWLEVRVAFEEPRFRLASARVKSLEVLTADRPLFIDVTSAAGVRAPGRTVADLTDFNWNWQGAAAGDVDGDGRLDLFVPSVPENKLYVNRGDGAFEDTAAAWGVAAPGGGTGALLVDMDNDGDQDLFVCHVEGPGLKLYENTGKGFKDVSEASGVARRAFAYSVTAGDIDRDGKVDLYVACYNAFGRVAPSSWTQATNGTPNLLFRNLGGGRFEECAAARGVADARWSYAALFADFDQDGDADLLVSNDYGDKGVYVNDGQGRFADEAGSRGARDTGNGMGVDCGDADGDGKLDLYFMNMSSTAGNRILKRLFSSPTGVEGTVTKLAAGNTLLLSAGAKFRDASAPAGVGPAEWSWGGGFLDFDNDGRLDIHVANGFITGKTAKDT